MVLNPVNKDHLTLSVVMKSLSLLVRIDLLFYIRALSFAVLVKEFYPCRADTDSLVIFWRVLIFFYYLQELSFLTVYKGYGNRFPIFCFFFVFFPQKWAMFYMCADWVVMPNLYFLRVH